MRKKLVKPLLIAGLNALCLSGIFVGCFAWFLSSVSVNNISGSGTTESAYFAYGDGLPLEIDENTGAIIHQPYGIRDTRHLNNLAWLQYHGYFDGKEPYFELAADINTAQGASTFVIPPIGTEDNPFHGHLDGNNKTINNIKVTNDESLFTNKPAGIDYDDENIPRIIGFFGVIGEIDDDPSSAIGSVTDLTLDNLTVHSISENTLIGLAAGYVNGHMEDVKVGQSTVSVDGCKPITEITDNLSDYALVGYTASTSTVSDFTKKVSENVYKKKSGGNIGGFGASIAFNELNERIYNIIKAGGPASTKLGASTAAYKYHEVKVNNEKVSSLTIARGGTNTTAKSYLEQDYDSSVDPKIYMLMDNRTFNGVTMPGTVQPLQMDTSTYEPTNDNTGYICSASSGETAGNIRSAAYPLLEIINSIQHSSFYNYADLYKSSYSSSPHKNLTYDEDELAVLTNASASYPNNNKFVLIKDDYNMSPSISGQTLNKYYYGEEDPDTVSPSSTVLNLQRYKQARDSMHEVLTNVSAETYPKIHGIHFMDASIAYNSTMSARVKINGIDGQTTPSYISSFPLLKNSIDFNFKETGYVTTFAGAYYANNNTTYAHCFFSIYDVNRGNNYSLTSASQVKRISQIYLNNDQSNEDLKYIYKYSDNTYSDGFSASNCGALQFDMQYVEKEPTYKNCLYYFEIPLNKGEYALGSVSGGGDGGYLLYLDIGANGKNAGWNEMNSHFVETSSSSDACPTGVDFNITGLTTVGGSTISIRMTYSDLEHMTTEMSGSIDFTPTTVVTVDAKITGSGCCYDSGDILDASGSTQTVADLTGSGGSSATKILYASIMTYDNVAWEIHYRVEGGGGTYIHVTKAGNDVTSNVIAGTETVPDVFTENVANIEAAAVAVEMVFHGSDFSVTSVAYDDANDTISLTVPPEELGSTTFTSVTYTSGNYNTLIINNTQRDPAP